MGNKKSAKKVQKKCVHEKQTKVQSFGISRATKKVGKKWENKFQSHKKSEEKWLKNCFFVCLFVFFVCLFFPFFVCFFSLFCLLFFCTFVCFFSALFLHFLSRQFFFLLFGFALFLLFFCTFSFSMILRTWL